MKNLASVLMVIILALVLPVTVATGSEELAPYLKANIDWQQVRGETIKILVSPHHFWKLTYAFAPQFEKLTGIKVTWEFVPPRKLREKGVLDLATGTAFYATHSADCMYYAMYVKNGWVEPLNKYLNDSTLTDSKWYDVEDVFIGWREFNTLGGTLWGMPVEGLVSLLYYRDDLYEKYGLGEPDTLEELMTNVEKLNDPPNTYGIALRGMQGSGQNYYIYSSLFNEFGGVWFNKKMEPQVNSEAGIKALTYYVDILQKYGSPGVSGWNWDSIVAAMQQEKIAQFIDNSSYGPLLQDPTKSRVVGKVGFARWPKGPTGVRCAGLWNWGLPINTDVDPRKKIAAWLFIQWATSKETQYRTAFLTTEEYKTPSRFDVNRASIMEDKKFRNQYGEKDFLDVVFTSIQKDTHPNWRPRISEYSEIGDTIALIIQQALIGEKSVNDALNWANKKVEDIMRRAGYFE